MYKSNVAPAHPTAAELRGITTNIKNIVVKLNQFMAFYDKFEAEHKQSQTHGVKLIEMVVA